MKKVFIISGILFVVVLGLWALYNIAFKHNPSDPVADPVQKELAKKKEGEIAVNPVGEIESAVNDTVVGAVLYEKSLYYYSVRNKDLRQIPIDGGSSTVLFSDIPGTPTRVIWSPRRDEALMLIERPGQAPLWHHINLSTKILTPLKEEMSRLAWTNIGDSILYQYTDPGNGAVSINMANPDGSNWKKLLDVDKGDYFLAPVPKSSLISFWRKPNGLELGRAETTTIIGEDRKVLFSDRFGLEILWSNDGSRLLIGSVTEKGKSEPSIGLANEKGGEYRDLNIPTLLSKVAWSKDNESIYYALPKAFSKETVLPNDYFSRNVTTVDTFWKMNVKTGKRERLIPLEKINENVDASELFLSEDELTLFFTDRMSGKLYRISL